MFGYQRHHSGKCLTLVQVFLLLSLPFFRAFSVFLFLLYFEEHPKDTTPSTHENCSNISKKVGKAEIQISTFVCLRCVTLFYTKNKMEQKIHY